MRVVVISDIHGNDIAFEKVMADLRFEIYDQLVCLGDAIQGGPQPAKVVARLRGLGCPVVMGNADAWLLTGMETGAETIASERLQKMNAVRDWALGQLSEADKAFIGTFQPTVEIPLSYEQNLLCFHGSPSSFDDVILPTTPELEFEGFLAAHVPHIMTGGHTHMQQIRRIGRSASFYFNPGSVGFAYSHQQPDDDFRAEAWAEYAILTAADQRVTLEFRRVPFDAGQLIDVYLNSGRPHAEDAVKQYQPTN